MPKEIATPPSRVPFMHPPDPEAHKPARNNSIWVEWLFDLYRQVSRGFDPVLPTAVAINPVGRGTITGTVSDIQELNDGNVLEIAEASGTPGISCEISFTKVNKIRGFAIKAYYSGSSSHWLETQLYNYITSAWDTFITYSDGNGMNYRYIEIPDGHKYVSDGDAIMRIYHPSNGTPSHDVYIDYAALT